MGGGGWYPSREHKVKIAAKDLVGDGGGGGKVPLMGA